VRRPSGAYSFEVQTCHAVRFKTKMEHVTQQIAVQLSDIKLKKIRSPVR
jgi:hypothetical protein